MKTKIYWHQNTKFLRNITVTGFIIATLLTLNSCQKNAMQEPAASQNLSNGNEDAIVSSTSNEMVLTWNEAATVAVARMGSGPNAIPPQPEALWYAMINIAMHDALNSIVLKYNRYALKDSTVSNASPDAAVAQAAHDAIVALLPPQQAYADSLLQVSLNSVPNGKAKTKGINLGKASAAAILANRANDGSANVQYTIAQGTLPGQYRSTPPFDETGFIAAPGWGNVKTFGLHSGSQFTPEPPYKVTSAEYTKDYNEVKKLGSNNSTVRTADQTQIGLFWLENAPHGWNNIARTMVAKYHLNAWKTARLLALLQIAEADDNIACMNAKYYYFYWRPITAIRLGDSDGNPDTKGDANWDILGGVTPPVPDYPSNHSSNGGAAAEVLEEFFQKDQISFSATSTSLPGVTRSFSSFSQAAHENALSRIYVGYHFRHACIEGQKQGEKIGQYEFIHVLGPAE